MGSAEGSFEAKRSMTARAAGPPARAWQRLCTSLGVASRDRRGLAWLIAIVLTAIAALAASLPTLVASAACAQDQATGRFLGNDNACMRRNVAFFAGSYTIMALGAAAAASAPAVALAGGAASRRLHAFRAAWGVPPAAGSPEAPPASVQAARDQLIRPTSPILQGHAASVAARAIAWTWLACAAVACLAVVTVWVLVSNGWEESPADLAWMLAIVAPFAVVLVGASTAAMLANRWTRQAQLRFRDAVATASGRTIPT